MRRLALLLALTACTGATVGSTTTTVAPPSGWIEVSPMTVARSEHPAVVLDKEVVVLGGFIERGLGGVGVTASVEAYSPQADSWRDLPDLPEPRHHGMAAVGLGRMFVIGGYDTAGDPTVNVWELVAGAWEDRAALPQPVAAGAAVTLGEAIYLVGGTPNGAFYHYDVGLDVWTELTGPSAREHLAAAVLDEEIWAIAGRWQGEIFDSVEIYNPRLAAWRPGPMLNEPRSGIGTATVGGGIIVAGGEVFDPDQALDSVERFDPGTGEWVLIESLPYGLHGNPLVAIGNDVYLPGGSTRARDVVNDGRVWRQTVGATP